MMAGLVVKPVDALSDEQVDGVRLIYEGAFSSDLRVPFGELARKGDADQMFVALDGQVPAGFAALRLLGSVNWIFLRYFAISGERQSQGLGREFWPLLRRSLRQLAWPPSIVFEVEHPGHAAHDEAERAVRERRISFWSACGASLLPAPGYVCPDYTGAGTEPMLLMAAAPAPAAAPAVRGDLLRRLVLAIYTERYALAPDDPLVSQALASIAA